MPTDSIQLQIVKNGGAPATGAITAAFSDSIVLGLGSTANGIKRVKYRIYEFPEGFSCPAGWTEEAANCYSVTVQNGADAPSFTLPASGDTLRGKYFFDAVGNDQRSNGSVVGDLRSKAQLKIPFINVDLEDVGYLESNEFDVDRQAVSAIKKAIRVIDAGVVVSGTGGLPAPALVATSNIALTGAVVVDSVNTNTLAAGSTVLATAQTTTANNGYWIINNSGAWTRPSYYNSDATVAAALGQLSAAVLGGTLGAGSSWFQSVGTTLAGAKTWTKLSTPSLLQDGLGSAVPAQNYTQHKGAAILRDPGSGRNTVDQDRVDIREYGGNPNGVQQTTHTSVASNASVALGSALTYAVGQWLLLHQAGAAHGLATPGTPILAVQGTPGTRTVSVKWVAATDHHGYTAASVATTVTTANIDATAAWLVTTTAPATRPAVNSTFTLTVTDSSIFTVGRPVTIAGDFYECYQCTAIPDGTHVTLKYLGGGVQGPITFGTSTSVVTYQYTEAWCQDVPGADKYICYVQFDGAGPYNYYGQIIAHPLPSGTGLGSNYFHPASIRITTSAAKTPPPGIPATAPSAAAPNALRTQITALVGTTATVSPVPTSSATGVCEICNKIPFEDAIAADITRSVELRLARGSYYCAGNLDVTHPAHVNGSNAGLQAVSSNLLFRDGCGMSLYNTKHNRAWQPGVRYRVGDRVTTDSVINAAGTWKLTVAGNGQTWAVSTDASAPPPWDNTLGSDTTDANGNVWRYDNTGWTAQGASFKHIGFQTVGVTAACQRTMQVADLRRNPNSGPMACSPFVAGATYATGAWVVPEQAKATGKIYQCLAGGVAGAGPASWGRVIGDSTSDGTLNWQCFDLQWLQGALIAQFTEGDFERCAAFACFGAAVALEGINGATGGNPSSSEHVKWFIGAGVSGNHIILRGADANLVEIHKGEFLSQGVGVGQAEVWNDYQANQLFAVQDASFYGAAVIDPFSQGYIGYQNARSGSVQCQGRLVNPYIENGGSGQAVVDYNKPSSVGPGGNYGKVRDSATAKRKSGPYNGLASVVASTPDLVLDDASTMQSDYDSVSKCWIHYNGDVTQAVTSRLMAQLNFGNYSAANGQQTLWQLNSTNFPVASIDHYGAHGRGIVLPRGLTSLVEGLSVDCLNHAQIRFINAVPTVGTFRLGDRLIWCADNRRLAIRPTVTGGLAPSAWASSHAYVNGDIVGQSSKTFVMVSSSGTSAGSLSGSFASAAVGDYIVEGGCCWYCWSGADPKFRAEPNWNAEPVALPDSNAALDITGGTVRTCSAFTANRAPALALTNAMAGDGMRFENQSAFTCSLPADGGTIVLPAKSWVELIMNEGATAWHQSDYGPLL